MDAKGENLVQHYRLEFDAVVLPTLDVNSHHASGRVARPRLRRSSGEGYVVRAFRNVHRVERLVVHRDADRDQGRSRVWPKVQCQGRQALDVKLEARTGPAEL